MTGEIGAAGDIATGALWARAVEPIGGRGTGEPADAGHGLCLNCGTRLDGAYCHACGQHAHVHKTMAAIGHDVAHSVFHFEGKTWRTLPMLALHPGDLTRRYIAGERARFVSPMAAFLFSVFLMFAVLGSLPLFNFAGSDFLKPGVFSGMVQARTKLAEEKARANAALAEDRQRLAKARTDSEPDAERIARLEKKVATDQKAVADLSAAERMLPQATTFDVEGAPPPTSENWLEAKWRHAKENPELLLYKLKNSAYKYSWALIPISLPFIWLLFPFRRDVGMYDHAVFATYSLTFMSLLAVALAVLAAIGVPAWICWTAAALIPPVHLYKQLKYGYGLGRWGTLWRLAWLLFFTTFSITFFALLLLWLGLE